MKKKTYQDEIRSIAEDRGVRGLVHFTQFGNLRGIVEHGLLSRKTLAEREYMFDPSDRCRLDDCLEAVSISISRVNEPMFAEKRRKTGDTHWVLLVLPSDILWTHQCLFSWRNAAKKEIRDHRGWRGGPWAFSEMFAGSHEDRSGLPRRHPTDIQAEVQVLEPIAPHWIRGAFVERPELFELVHTILGEKRQVLEVDSFLEVDLF